MTLEEIIFLKLGPLVDDRVWPLVAPAGTARPYIVFTPASNQGSYTLRRAGNLDRRLTQIDVYAEGYDQAEALAKASRFALEAVGGQLSNEGRHYEQSTQLFRARLDIFLWNRPQQ